MPDRARVSVVIPVDNAERYVEASVRRALVPYATSTDRRWFMGLITAALLELKDEGWTRG
jgi:hypothetical protein